MSEKVPAFYYKKFEIMQCFFIIIIIPSYEAFSVQVHVNELLLTEATVYCPKFPPLTLRQRETDRQMEITELMGESTQGNDTGSSGCFLSMLVFEVDDRLGNVASEQQK